MSIRPKISCGSRYVNVVKTYDGAAYVVESNDLSQIIWIKSKAQKSLLHGEKWSGVILDNAVDHWSPWPLVHHHHCLKIALEERITTFVARASGSTTMMNNKVVGLEFQDGHIWYHPRSSLALVGGYFEALFHEDAMVPAGAEHMDEHRRKVFFIDCDRPFVKHILPCITSRQPGKLLLFSDGSELWWLLREEAHFYVLDDLNLLLHVMHSISPNFTGQGVVYWLGTAKGREDYKNLLACRLVHIIGWPHQEDILASLTYLEPGDFAMALTPSSLEVPVQYHPPVKGVHPAKCSAYTAIRLHSILPWHFSCFYVDWMMRELRQSLTWQQYTYVQWHTPSNIVCVMEQIAGTLRHLKMGQIGSFFKKHVEIHILQSPPCWMNTPWHKLSRLKMNATSN